MADNLSGEFSRMFKKQLRESRFTDFQNVLQWAKDMGIHVNDLIGKDGCVQIRNGSDVIHVYPNWG